MASAKGIEFAGSIGEGIKGTSSTNMATTGMGGKGKIDSPVAGFPTGSNSTAMPKGKVTGKGKIDSPVAGN